MSVMGRLVFITGTDTGVGKTFLSALLLVHLRNCGVRARAMKLFASGDRKDARLFDELQGSELPRRLLNPFFFPAAIAPGAQLKAGPAPALENILDVVRNALDRSEVLIVEGIGGLLVPVTEKLLVIDVIAALNPSLVLVAQNKVGVINHTLLSIEALCRRGCKKICVVLMGMERPDASVQTNYRMLRKRSGVSIYQVEFFGKTASQPSAVKRHAKKIEKVLASLSKTIKFTAAFRKKPLHRSASKKRKSS